MNPLQLNADCSMRCNFEPASNIDDLTEPDSRTNDLSNTSTNDRITTDYNPLKNFFRPAGRRQGAGSASRHRSA
jgi:hypothetical protein